MPETNIETIESASAAVLMAICLKRGEWGVSYNDAHELWLVRPSGGDRNVWVRDTWAARLAFATRVGYLQTEEFPASILEPFHETVEEIESLLDNETPFSPEWVMGTIAKILTGIDKLGPQWRALSKASVLLNIRSGDMVFYKG